MSIRNEHEMIIESKPSALDISQMSLQESIDRAWRESHGVFSKEPYQPPEMVHQNTTRIDFDINAECEMDLKLKLQRKYFSQLKLSQEAMKAEYERLQGKIEDEIDEMAILMELQTNPSAYYTKFDRDGWGYDPVEIGKVISDLPEAHKVIRTERAIRAPQRLALIVSDKTHEELSEAAKQRLLKAKERDINLMKARLSKLISDHQRIAKEYKQELSQIVSFNDFLSVPKNYSKVI
ncbi:hypothetical protein KDV42_23085 [Citrobacter freundii]|uniref:hypothetical protein n=1 Tax=Citrobacter freundii TaxID=546 RepID=UPI003334C65B